MPNITQFSPHSGRYIKDDGSVVNLAEKIEAIYNALIVGKNAGVQLTGSSLLEAQALYIQKKGWEIVELSNSAGDTIAASTSKIYWLANPRNIDEIIVQFLETNMLAHSNQMQIGYYAQNSGVSLEFIDLIPSGNRLAGVSGFTRVKYVNSGGYSVGIIIKNNDTVDHTYRVYLSKKYL